MLARQDKARTARHGASFIKMCFLSVILAIAISIESQLPSSKVSFALQVKDWKLGRHLVGQKIRELKVELAQRFHICSRKEEKFYLRCLESIIIVPERTPTYTAAVVNTHNQRVFALDAKFKHLNGIKNSPSMSVFSNALKSTANSLGITKLAIETHPKSTFVRYKMVFATASDSRSFKEAYVAGNVPRALAKFVEILVTVRGNKDTTNTIAAQVISPRFQGALAGIDFVVSGVTRTVLSSPHRHWDEGSGVSMELNTLEQH